MYRCIKFEVRKVKGSQDIEWSVCSYVQFDSWPLNIKINRDHLFFKMCQCTKFWVHHVCFCLFGFFWVARAIFQLAGDCHHYRWQAANLDLCLALTAFSSEGSFTCHTYCDTGPPFLRPYPKDPWFYLLNDVLLAKKQSLPILNVLGLTRPARAGLELTTSRLLSESTTTRLRQPVSTPCKVFSKYWEVSIFSCQVRSLTLEIKIDSGNLFFRVHQCTKYEVCQAKGFQDTEWSVYHYVQFDPWHLTYSSQNQMGKLIFRMYQCIKFEIHHVKSSEDIKWSVFPTSNLTIDLWNSKLN
jgi:hypothetical protein